MAIVSLWMITMETITLLSAFVVTLCLLEPLLPDIYQQRFAFVVELSLLVLVLLLFGILICEEGEFCRHRARLSTIAAAYELTDEERHRP